ncbi:hypothetical protein AC578_1948 [Lecanosticta acicola]|uniref:F-box domain-containing protein n=1 Tax=Lecanosticta acicola TaxID=111012 RepID=A0AAI8YS65_9PEZI|nr:hypothetical protein AC578_1948 [Lecanosticta acicola]
MDAKWLPLMQLPPSAAARVFGVGELVEEILEHLSPADVVTCRRVSKKFLGTVAYSKALRQKLYLEPDAGCERHVNPLAPSWFYQQRNGYRDSTIAARIDLVKLWEDSGAEPRPYWDKMLVSQPPSTTCVIPVGSQVTIYFRRYYPQGMTFGDLERAVIAAYEIRNGRQARKERLEELSEYNSVLIYWR